MPTLSLIEDVNMNYVNCLNHTYGLCHNKQN